MRFIRIAAATACLSLPAVSFAQPVSWMVEGVVTSASLNPAIQAAFPAGAPLRLHLTYDPAAPESTWNGHHTNPAIGHYVFGIGPGASHLYDLEVRRGHHRFYVQTSEWVYVRPGTATMENDGAITEMLTGDRVGHTPVFKPHYIEWGLSWPGSAFSSDALPTTFPHQTPTGSIELNFRTCADTQLDPCAPGAQQRARAEGTIHSMKPVVRRQIAVTPGAFWTLFAILGEPTFLPNTEVDPSTIELSMANRRWSAHLDINGDGHLDLVGLVRTGDIRRRPNETIYRLIARTTNGDYISGVAP